MVDKKTQNILIASVVVGVGIIGVGISGGYLIVKKNIQKQEIEKYKVVLTSIAITIGSVTAIVGGVLLYNTIKTGKLYIYIRKQGNQYINPLYQNTRQGNAKNGNTNEIINTSLINGFDVNTRSRDRLQQSLQRIISILQQYNRPGSRGGAKLQIKDQIKTAGEWLQYYLDMYNKSQNLNVNISTIHV